MKTRSNSRSTRSAEKGNCLQLGDKEHLRDKNRYRIRVVRGEYPAETFIPRVERGESITPVNRNGTWIAIITTTHASDWSSEPVQITDTSGNFAESGGCFISTIHPEKIRDEIRHTLHKIKAVDNSKVSLGNITKVIQNLGIEVDELEHDCQQGIKKAEEVLKIIQRHDKDNRKAELLK